MSPWNPPNISAMTKAWRQFTIFMPSPLQTATAKASIDSPTPITNSSIKPMIPSLNANRDSPMHRISLHRPKLPHKKNAGERRR